MNKVYTKKDIKEGPEEKDMKSSKSYKVPVILVVVWALIIVLFGYSLWLGQNDKNTDELFEETAIGPAENQNTNTSPAVNMNEQQKEQARIKDSKRLADIKRLRIALQSYYDDNGYYPETLDNLKPDYLEEIPQNPFPGGQDYVYTGIGSKPYGYYEISYALELGSEGIEAGIHVASPDSVALW